MADPLPNLVSNQADLKKCSWLNPLVQREGLKTKWNAHECQAWQLKAYNPKCSLQGSNTMLLWAFYQTRSTPISQGPKVTDTWNPSLQRIKRSHLGDTETPLYQIDISWQAGPF